MIHIRKLLEDLAPPMAVLTPEDREAQREMSQRLLTVVVVEIAGYRIGKWQRRRKVAGVPPLFGSAGKAGYVAGYRDGQADAQAAAS